MKKRITIILAIVLILSCLLVLSSCDSAEETSDTTLVDAYNLAVEEGFEGTQEEWIESLTAGKSAYEIAVEHGFAGTEEDWLASLKGEDGEDGVNGVDGKDGEDGKDGVDIQELYQLAVDEGYDGTLLEFLSYINFEVDSINNTEYVANQAMRSVVSINTYFTEVYTNVWGQSTTSENVYAGSGVIYKLNKEAGDAYIITNYHVVYSYYAQQEDKICDDIRIKTYGAEYSDYEIKTEEGGATVEYIGGSMNFDIAIIKVTNSEYLKIAPVEAVNVYDSPYIDIGSTAVVVGNPSGSGLSSTAGIVSVDSEYIEMTAVDNVTTVSFRVLRVDAPINGGNSGGGLFNSNGELIGIVNAKCIQENIDNVGYAIPVNTVVNVADNLIANYESGNTDKTLKRVMIGIAVSRDSSKGVYDEETNTMKIVETLSVGEIVEDSAAERAGLLVDDELVSVEINGEVIILDREYILREKLIGLSVGDSITLNIIRDGEERAIDITFNESDLNEVA